MANGFSFTTNGYNGTMGYTDNTGYHFAGVRVRDLSYSYGVTSDESHARTERAFYPHRRVQGQFALTLDCIGYSDFKRTMTWLQAYADSMLTSAEESANYSITLLDVQVPSRKFHKIGIITTGIDDHDQVGSMVFNPQLVFMSLADPADPAISLLNVTDVSTFKSPQTDANATTAFYPVTVANYKDKLLYDDLGKIDSNAAIRILTQGENFVASPSGGKQVF